jgi:sialate O-acetylesterase
MIKNAHLRKVILSILINASLYSVVHAAVELPAIFSDHSVLQMECPVPVWGRAKPGERVSVEFAGQKKETSVDAQGNWMIKLEPMLASAEPQTMTVRSPDSERKLCDVLVGEVWLCSGQSNMYHPIGKMSCSVGVTGGAAEIARPEQAELRLYCNANHKDWKNAGLSGWQRANSTSLPPFSSTAYFFGKAIQTDLKVPVGLINISAGGSPISPWTPKEAALKVPIVHHYHELFEENKVEIEKHNALMNRYQEVWRQRAAGGPTTNPPPTLPGPLPYNLFMAQRLGGPFGLFEGLIAPIVPYALRGVIWYQGEANADNLELSLHYDEMLRTLITSWRDRWGQPKLPFYFVQLPCWENSQYASTWHVNRQGMLNVLRSMADVGMVVTADVGDVHNLHPANKRPVGERLALWALAKTYGKPVVCSGPLVREIAAEGDKLRVEFDTYGSALKLHGPTWNDLEVAGEDGLYYPATATVSANMAIVASPSVRQPVSVRYGWKSVFTPTLFNTEGLPASPFVFPPLKPDPLKQTR